MATGLPFLYEWGIRSKSFAYFLQQQAMPSGSYLLKAVYQGKLGHLPPVPALSLEASSSIPPSRRRERTSGTTLWDSK